MAASKPEAAIVYGQYGGLVDNNTSCRGCVFDGDRKGCARHLRNFSMCRYIWRPLDEFDPVSVARCIILGDTDADAE